jgi:hypothetical protein
MVVNGALRGDRRYGLDAANKKRIQTKGIFVKISVSRGTSLCKLPFGSWSQNGQTQREHSRITSTPKKTFFLRTAVIQRGRVFRA